MLNRTDKVILCTMRICAIALISPIVWTIQVIGLVWHTLMRIRRLPHAIGRRIGKRGEKT